MRYIDPLYGAWELPEFIEKISHTREMVRLRNIAQSVMPNCITPHGAIPSRFHHGLGVAYLATAVLKKNPILSDFQILLPLAGLLHDAGNPPFSHLGEYFLKELTGKDGESFLEDILDGSETEQVIKELGLKIPQILSLVTGKAKPFSEILNGSIDIDNLDNVGRFHLAAGLGRRPFDAVHISSSFRFDGKEWILIDECFDEVQKWKHARAAVYGVVYGDPHLNVSAMMFRAMELAFSENNLSRDFFFLDDLQALEFLLNRCNVMTARLVQRALRWEWYEEVVCFEFTNPTDKRASLASHWSSRKKLADSICQRFGIPYEDVCVYAGKGKDVKEVTTPFTNERGEKRYDNGLLAPYIYRIKVYTSLRYLSKKCSIADFVAEETM